MSKLIIPAQKGEAFLEDVRNIDTSGENFQLWWLGQSGFLVHFQGEYLMIDPYLSDSLTQKYAQTDKPHIRMTEIVIDPHALNFIKVVTSSHNHTDHLDGVTLKVLLRKNKNIKLIIPEANRAFVCERLGCDFGLPIGLNDGESVSVGRFSFYGIPAAHNEISRDNHDRCHFMGYVISFGKWKIYHSGDTLWFDGLVDMLKPLAIDVAILPINGNRPERRVAGNLNTEEAAQLAHAIAAAVVIPCHYDMFTFNTADPRDFINACKKLGQNYAVLQAGERWSPEYLKQE